MTEEEREEEVEILDLEDLRNVLTVTPEDIKCRLPSEGENSLTIQQRSRNQID